MKTEKDFDTVKAMREIRDAISRESQEMNFEQERKYVHRYLKARKEEATVGAGK